ncbi:MAG: DUF2793 domain-containing protein [Pseudorhodobacter sp.]|nr:DUF2793 domain-containing protein [Pseudorhodobacter sp.]
MSDVSPLLALPLILADQAQKHVSHNEAIDLLDVLVQLVVEQIDAITPPPAAVEGAVWALGEVPVGAWAGQALRLASWRGGTWVFIAPVIGWRAWVRGAGVLRVFTGSGWVGLLGAGDLQNLGGIGINTTSDATNKLAVASAATLLSHVGAGHQLKLNKATPGDTASLLFQSDWSGRAEMGLAGSDDFSVKVSADGAAWNTALILNRTTGIATGAAVVQSSVDAVAGRLLRTGHVGTGLGAFATCGGSANALTLATGGSLPSLPTGLKLRFIATATNTAAATVAVDGLAVKTIKTVTGAVLPAGYLRTGRVTEMTWDGVSFIAERQIERGSNGNGSYVKWADGTQMCTAVIALSGLTNIATGAVFRSASNLWVFPAVFLAPPSALANEAAGPGGCWGSLGFSAPTTTSISFMLISPVTIAVAQTAALTATGKWY